MNPLNRRSFIRDLGLAASVVPFVAGLPSLAAEPGPKQRLIFMFSPNGTIPPEFWPDEEGENFQLKRILKPLEAYKSRMLLLKGISNKVRGDGDGHMRGMSCLLTGKELFPGNIQGGSDTPAGWCKGISIDQEIKNFFQSTPETRTRFGSLEFGVGVPDRADPWTRMSYGGPNQPIAPVDDPYQMFRKVYGGMQDRESLGSILDDLYGDLKRVQQSLDPEERAMLEKHAAFVREMEQSLEQAEDKALVLAPPKFKDGVTDENDHIPDLCRMQTDLLVNAFANDMARVATLQFTKSVGGARMRWLGIEDGHHSLSHHEDNKEDSQEKLTKINIWFAEQLTYLVQQLDQTPEPGGEGSMLDHTTILWANELGKGNSHTLENLPFVFIGGGLNDFKMGRSLRFDNIAHNRLLMSIAHGVGHHLDTFGNPDLSAGGALSLS
ncbi:MAG: hypothetical protein ACI9TH_001767 [Kiritimatiellia bacterium]|jgi:hypothetical protein